jgi:hypothetical protein
METHLLTYAAMRQKELLNEADRLRAARRVKRLERCRAQDGPTTVNLFIDALLGRRTAPMAC